MHAKFYVLHDNPGQLYDNFQETGNPARSPLSIAQEEKIGENFCGKKLCPSLNRQLLLHRLKDNGVQGLSGCDYSLILLERSPLRKVQVVSVYISHRAACFFNDQGSRSVILYRIPRDTQSAMPGPTLWKGERRYVPISSPHTPSMWAISGKSRRRPWKSTRIWLASPSALTAP